MRMLFITTLLASLTSCSQLAVKPEPTLVGRWKAETVPTGYWVIDRYQDGRYARKSVLLHDLAKPAEIVTSWGRWEWSAHNYREVIDGSTSEFLKGFMGKWKDVQVDALEDGAFQFRSQEGYPRKETRIPVTGPLPSMELEKPIEGDGGWATPAHGWVRPGDHPIPEWINQPPK